MASWQMQSVGDLKLNWDNDDSDEDDYGPGGGLSDEDDDDEFEEVIVAPAIIPPDVQLKEAEDNVAVQDAPSIVPIVPVPTQPVTQPVTRIRRVRRRKKPILPPRIPLRMRRPNKKMKKCCDWLVYLVRGGQLAAHVGRVFAILLVLVTLAAGALYGFFFFDLTEDYVSFDESDPNCNVPFTSENVVQMPPVVDPFNTIDGLVLQMDILFSYRYTGQQRCLDTFDVPFQNQTNPLVGFTRGLQFELIRCDDGGFPVIKAEVQARIQPFSADTSQFTAQRDAGLAYVARILFFIEFTGVQCDNIQPGSFSVISFDQLNFSIRQAGTGIPASFNIRLPAFDGTADDICSRMRTSVAPYPCKRPLYLRILFLVPLAYAASFGFLSAFLLFLAKLFH